MRVAHVELIVNGESQRFEYQNAIVQAQCYVGYQTPFEIRVNFFKPHVDGVEYMSHPISNVVRYWNSEKK